MVAVYLRSRRPDCRLVKARTQKVAALRRYLRGPVKSDRLDALTLAKMPFIDPEQRMRFTYLPPKFMLCNGSLASGSGWNRMSAAARSEFQRLSMVICPAYVEHLIMPGLLHSELS
jgi:hypothetical protein